METEGSLPPATCPYPEEDQSSPSPPSNVLQIHFNIIIPSTHRSNKSYFFPQVSPPKSYTHLSCLPYVLHALPISFFSIWSPEEHSNTSLRM